jgi:hypothetical protein
MPSSNVQPVPVAALTNEPNEIVDAANGLAAFAGPLCDEDSRHRRRPPLRVAGRRERAAAARPTVAAITCARMYLVSSGATKGW